jgi:hypothetical protein
MSVGHLQKMRETSNGDEQTSWRIRPTSLLGRFELFGKNSFEKPDRNCQLYKRQDFSIIYCSLKKFQELVLSFQNMNNFYRCAKETGTISTFFHNRFSNQPL